jgi:hypothetical protein
MSNSEETVSVGEAAQMLRSAGVRSASAQTVRRLVERGYLDAHWTRPSARLWTRDTGGRLLRGHRRITVASVREWIAREQAKRPE